jgi:hypothetical protein
MHNFKFGDLVRTKLGTATVIGPIWTSSILVYYNKEQTPLWNLGSAAESLEIDNLTVLLCLNRKMKLNAPHVYAYTLRELKLIRGEKKDKNNSNQTR